MDQPGFEKQLREMVATAREGGHRTALWTALALVEGGLSGNQGKPDAVAALSEVKAGLEGLMSTT